MKKIIFIIIFYSTVFSQDKKVEILENLQDVSQLLSVIYYDEMQYELTFTHNEYKAKTDIQILDIIDEYIMKVPLKSEIHGQIAEYNVVKKYKEIIRKLFIENVFFHNDFAGYVPSFGNPIRVGLLNNDTTIIFHGLASQNIYNTIRTTAKKRASSIISSLILPLLDKVYDRFENTGFANIGIVVVYGTKDFTDDTGYDNELPESVCVILPIAKIKEYNKAIITENELIKNGNIYMHSRDMSSGFKKIDIVLE